MCTVDNDVGQQTPKVPSFPSLPSKGQASHWGRGKTDVSTSWVIDIQTYDFLDVSLAKFYVVDEDCFNHDGFSEDAD